KPIARASKIGQATEGTGSVGYLQALGARLSAPPAGSALRRIQCLTALALRPVQVQPASNLYSWPVHIRDASEARNSTKFATSSGWIGSGRHWVRNSSASA